MFESGPKSNPNQTICEVHLLQMHTKRHFMTISRFNSTMICKSHQNIHSIYSQVKMFQSKILFPNAYKSTTSQKLQCYLLIFHSPH